MCKKIRIVVVVGVIVVVGGIVIVVCDVKDEGKVVVFLVGVLMVL